MNINSVLIAAAIGCSAVSDLSAQATQAQATTPAPKSNWELIVPSGALLPTGAQRDAIKRGNLTAVQLMYVIRPEIAITSTSGSARRAPTARRAGGRGCSAGCSRPWRS